jgi:hypothetical protein
VGEKTANDYLVYVKRYIEYWNEVIPTPAEKKLTKYNTQHLKGLDKSASVKNASLRAAEYYYDYHDMEADIEMRYDRRDTSPPCLSRSQYRDILIKGANRKRDAALVLFLGSRSYTLSTSRVGTFYTAPMSSATSLSSSVSIFCSLSSMALIYSCFSPLLRLLTASIACISSTSLTTILSLLSS